MKTRVLTVVAFLAVMFVAVPAFAGHPHAHRHVNRRPMWSVPVGPPPPRVMRHYYPPVYVAPRVAPYYVPPRYRYWVGEPYYYDNTDVRIGVHRGGFGLHLGF